MGRQTRSSLVIVVMCFIAVRISVAQEPMPTYEETAAWIESKFPSLNGLYVSGGNSLSLAYTFVSMVDCKLSFNATNAFEFSSGAGYGNPVNYQIDLAKVSHVSVSNNDGVPAIEIVCSSLAFEKRQSETSWTPYKTIFIYTANPNVDNADLGPRLVKALNHAAAGTDKQ